MAIRASDIAFRYLVTQRVERSVPVLQLRYFQSLHSPHMVELKNDRIRLAAVHARVGREIISDDPTPFDRAELIGTPDIRDVPYSRVLVPHLMTLPTLRLETVRAPRILVEVADRLCASAGVAVLRESGRPGGIRTHVTVQFRKLVHSSSLPRIEY